MAEHKTDLELAQQLAEIGKAAVKKCTEWFDRIDNKWVIYHSNEHLFTSFIVNHFNDFLKNFKENYYLTIETNREIVEFASGFFGEARDLKKESKRHRFDIVVWKENIPIGVIEVKANEQFKGIEGDISKLWHVLRRTDGFGLKFGMFILYIPLSKDVESKWHERVKQLKKETYQFTSNFLSWSRGSDEKKNGCGVIILTHEDIGRKWKLTK